MNDIKLRFKCCLIGDGSVGKTSFCKKLLSSGYDIGTKYIPTLGVEVHPILIETNYGNIMLDVWDTVGQEKFGTLRSSWYSKSKVIIIMFDVTSLNSYNNVMLKWYDDVIKFSPNSLIILCGNKIDLINSRIVHENMAKQLNLTYFDISAKNNVNLNEVLFYIVQNLTNIQNIKFLDRPVLYNKNNKTKSIDDKYEDKGMTDDDIYIIDDNDNDNDQNLTNDDIYIIDDDITNDITNNLLIHTSDPLPIIDKNGEICWQNELNLKKRKRQDSNENKEERETIEI
jgi:GTP-binding nuclear protein Ran